MNGGPKDGNPRKILVATDGSRDSLSAVRRAAAMAHAFGSELFLAHVVPVSAPYHMSGADFDDGPSLYEEDLGWARKLLDDQVEETERAGGKIAGAYLKEGEPDVEVLALAEQLGADLIVTGGRGTSPLRRPIGSISSSIAAHAHCPVMVVRNEHR